MSAMPAFRFECGRETVSWKAEFALRTRVSRSATGSVIVIAVLLSSGFREGPGPRTDPPSGGLLSLRRDGGAERESEGAEQCPALVVGLGGRDHGDVEAADPVDAVLVDLVEHALLGQTERVVAVAVELAVRQAAEVADAGQRQREQAVEELPRTVASQRHVRTDRLALAQLELRDGLAGAGDL